MYVALQRLQFWGIKIFSVATGDLTDKTGKLLASVMGWKDEAYLEDLRDKTRRGLAGRAQRALALAAAPMATAPSLSQTRRDGPTPTGLH